MKMENFPPVVSDLNVIKEYIHTVSDPVTIVFAGDDITFAAGQASGYRNYMQHFEERIRWELSTSADSAGAIRRQNFVFNTGMKGITAAGLLNDFNRLVSGLKPKMVFAMLGMGDAAKNTCMDEFKSSIHALVNEIRRIGAVPVLQTGIYPIETNPLAKIRPYVDAIKEIAYKENVVLANHFDSWRSYSDLPELIGSDGMLPNELGHLRLAKELMTLLDIGGEGYTWNISRFTDTKELASRKLDKEICFATKKSMIPADLEALIRGSEPVTWLFSGDSITHGALHTLGHKSFAELFGERIRGEMAAEFPAREKDLILNTGVSSMTTRDLMANFDRWITENNPDAVFLSFGMNDASNNLVPLDEYKLNLQTAVQRIRSLGAIPVLQTLNTVKPADAGRHTNLLAYVDAIRNIAQEEQVLLVDHYKYWVEAEKYVSDIKDIWMNDNIHPNQIGTAHMARLIFKTIGIYDSNSYISNMGY